MTALPMVQRELRVAARRRATYWNRCLAVLVATAITFWMVLGYSSLGPGRLGVTLFAVLSKLAYLGCLFPGVFLTADCLSAEKRDGTLGLLFLTDLRGYDVVLGKLMVTSLKAFYAMLGTLPLLALPVLLGGVTFGELGRTMLALVNTVLFSLALGMFVSSISWKAQRAIMAAAGLLFLLGCILPALPGPLEWLSPRLAFRLSADTVFALKPSAYAFSLLTIQGLSWGLLFLASRKAPDCSQTQTIKAEEPAWNRQQRAELLNRNPIEWLATRKRSSGWVWASLGLVAVGWFVVALEAGRAGGNDFVASFYMALSLHAVLKFWIAWEASRRFSEDRRNGTLELLVSTPLSVASLLRGQAKILYHEFITPVRAVLVLDFIFMSWLGSSSFFGLSTPGAMASFVIMMVMLGVDGWALGWVGLWLGLKGKSDWAAAFGALARIILLPMSLFLVMTPFMPGRSPLALIVLWGLIGGITSWLFGMDARSKLHTRFRQTLTDAPRAGWSFDSATASPEARPELGEYYSLFDAN